MITDENGKSYHDVWPRVIKQGEQIADLATAQAKTDEQLQSLITIVTQGFDRNDRSIDRLNRPANFGLLAAVAFGSLTLFGGYAMLLINPVNERFAYATERNQAIFASIDDDIHSERNRVSALESQLSYLSGKQLMIEKQMSDIDNIGSRYRRNENVRED